ncbi:amino acid adenylation domain-containing protein [Streptomyces ziwulingensis]|uniref:Carrier domain-containing protein n=1 Tax=Streptomyces ziwulingensis TaxID=1045501 RepID=A0ABP9CK77_9ACTN
MTAPVGERASVVQQGMWLASRLAPGSPAFTVSTASRLTGPLDLAALRAALREIIARHEILRTRFVERDGRLLAEAVPDVTVPLDVLDLSSRPRQAAVRAARLRVEARAAEPFDMTRPPLLRAGAVRLAPEEHLVHLDLHHAVCDGWSLRLLLGEIEEVYAGLTGADAGRPAVPSRPGYWEYLHGGGAAPDGAGAADLDFWREHLAGVRPLELPGRSVAGPRGAGAPGGQVRFTLDGELLARVDALAQRLCTTRFVVLLSAFQALLGVLCDSRDVPVGTTVSQRDGADAERVVGPLFNTVVLRGDLGGDPRFAELVERNADRFLDVLEHRYAPFETVLRELRRTSAVSAPNPLFNVLFEVDYEAPEALRPAGTRAEPWPFAFTTPKSDLDLALAPYGTGLRGTLTYRTSACDARTAGSVGERLGVLLDAVTDEARGGSRLRLHELPVLTADEPARLEALADGGPGELPDACLHELFERQVRRAPDAVAVREAGPDGPGAELTYAELDARADRIARALTARGVGPETRVAVHLHRSADLVAALLGVGKAGGAYVPLDPAFPLARLRHLVADSGAAVVLTEPGLAAAAANLGAPVMSVREEAPPGTVRALAPARPHHLCYVIYTSGSTGRPKGVLVEHRGLVNFLMWCVRRYVGDRTGGAPLFSSIAFDMIVPNLFAPLLTGQPVTVVPETVSPAGLGEVLHAAGPFAFVKLTPGHLELLTGSLAPRQARSLAGLLVVGADAFPRAALAAWRRLDPHTPVLNEYGPTEASVANSVHEVGEDDGDGPGELPIGLPVPRTTLRVLNAALNRVPPGVTGEIYIGGDCVVRGYRGLPALTASRFVPDPYGPPGARMYRTGDLGRWNADGEAEFLGRVDHQVKIRGHRVEPAEVESAMAGHPAVRRAVVVPSRTPSGRLALAAYAVPRSARRPTAELRAYLGEALPPYLVPAAITWLDALPLNENGKTDRAALPPPAWRSEDPAGRAGRPLGGTAGELAVIWSELLGLPASGIGADDDFFALGGDSLLVLALLERLRARYDRRVPFEEVLRSPTVSALADLIDAPDPAARAGAGPGAGAARGSLGRIQGGAGDAPALVLVHPVGGTVFCYRHLVAELPPSQPVYGLTLASMLDGGDVSRDGDGDGEDGLAPMCARYAREVSGAVAAPVVVAGWSAGAPVALETARQLSARGHEVAGLVLLDPCAPDDAEGWRRQERELAGMSDRLRRSEGARREEVFRSIVRSELVAMMGVDPASCRSADRFPQEVLRVWQRQCARLAAHRPGRYRGDLCLVTSADDAHSARWEALVTGTVTRTGVGGGHVGMLRPPYAGAVARAVGALLPGAGAGGQRS